MKRFVLSVAVVLALSSVTYAKGPRVSVSRTNSANGLTYTIQGGGNGRSGRNNNVRQPTWYDYFAGQAVARTQRLYGPVPGAGGMQFIDGPVSYGSPIIIENPFCKHNDD